MWVRVKETEKSYFTRSYVVKFYYSWRNRQVCKESTSLRFGLSFFSLAIYFFLIFLSTVWLQPWTTNFTIGTETFTCGGGFLVHNLLFLCNFLTPISLHLCSVPFLFISMRLRLCLPTARTKSHFLACCLVFCGLNVSIEFAFHGSLLFMLFKTQKSAPLRNPFRWWQRCKMYNRKLFSSSSASDYRIMMKRREIFRVMINGVKLFVTRN